MQQVDIAWRIMIAEAKMVEQVMSWSFRLYVIIVSKSS
jgi:hypothetical protein